MNRLIGLVLRHGVPLVAANVFLEQIGVPIPAVPTLMIAGALARNGQMSSTHVMVWAVIASLVADSIWFILGRRYGYRILRLLCRISLSPDSCVRDTEANFERWGMKSLLIAKFVPGFSTIAPPLAGATNSGIVPFIIYDGFGALLWAGAAVVVGRVFHRAIGSVVDRLENLGGWAIVFAVSALALFIIVKWWQRIRFLKQLRVARVQPDELKAMFDSGTEPLIVDARSAGARKRDPRHIPNAIVASPEELIERLRDADPSKEIVLYCT
ncbi:MAG TPA: VTT domain-containing protein [Thermoanaerobaculia bacterium]|nr:VTT domain-containing protein [Thermoanaerobaculia bacterium]